MKIALLFFLGLNCLAFGQNCVYTFTYQAQNFSFCVTSYGTIGSLQSPIGTEHLGLAEGWAVMTIGNEGGGQAHWNHITGVSGNTPASPTTVKQPNGTGKLPLIFEWNGIEKETVTAIPMQRIVNILYTLTPSTVGDPPKPDSWTINASRAAELRPDGVDVGKFANSSLPAFGYNPSTVGFRQGVKLEVRQGMNSRGVGHAGIAHQPISLAIYDADGPPGEAEFTGAGIIFATAGDGAYFTTTKPLSVTWTYEVF